MEGSWSCDIVNTLQATTSGKSERNNSVEKSAGGKAGQQTTSGGSSKHPTPVVVKSKGFTIFSADQAITLEPEIFARQKIGPPQLTLHYKNINFCL